MNKIKSICEVTPHLFLHRIIGTHLPFLLLLVCISKPLYVSCQQYPKLDTLNTLKTPEERISYVLKVEESLPFIIRDSLVDQAISEAEELGNDSLLYHVLISATYINHISDEFEEAKRKVERTYELAQKLESEEFRIGALNNLASYHQRAGEFNTADSIYIECIKYWATQHDTVHLSKAYNNRATVYLRQGDFGKADSLVQIAKYYGEQVDVRVQTSALNTELVISAYRGQSQKAFEVSNTILSLLDSVQENYLPFYADCLANNGEIASMLHYFPSAINSLIKADSIYQVLGNERGQTSILENIASLYEQLGDYDLAMEYSQKGVDLARQVDNPVALADAFVRLVSIRTSAEDTSLLSGSKDLVDSAYQIYQVKGVGSGLGNCYAARGQMSILEGELDSASLHFVKALNIFGKEDYRYMRNPVYLGLSDVLEQQGKYRGAFAYIDKVSEEDFETEREQIDFLFQKGKLLSKIGKAADAAPLLVSAYEKNTLLQQTISAAEIKEVGDRYQSEKQLAISEKLKAEQKLGEVVIRKQRQTILAGGVGLFLFSLLAYWLYRQSKRREQLNAELEAQRNKVVLLNQELNHRVKNNLAFMTTLLEMQGRRSVQQETKEALQESESRLRALSLLHSNLFKSNPDSQIELKLYITEILQNLKELFDLDSKSLHISTQLVDVTFDAEDAMRVGLIINELVTNSVKHAFGNVDEPAISVDTVREGEHIVIRYRDNGPSQVKSTIDKDSGKQHLGMKLIKLLEQQVSEVARFDVA